MLFNKENIKLQLFKGTSGKVEQILHLKNNNPGSELLDFLHKN